MDSEDITIEDLEKLVYEDELSEIESQLSKFNVFSVLRVSYLENIHSNFLAWILNPPHNHGLSDYPLKKFLKYVFKQNRIYELHNVSIVELDLWDMSNIEVHRERDHIDIQLVDEKNKFVCIIENKIRHKQQKGQLLRYKNAINSRYPDYNHKLFLFLTVEGEEPEDEDYLTISYNDLIEILNSIYESKQDQLVDEVKYFFEDYVTTLKDQIMDDSNLKERAQKVYRKHKEALDYIYDNKPDQQLAIKEALVEWVKKNPELKEEDSHKSRIRFIPYSIESKIPKDELKNWTSSGNMLLFEFHNEIEKLDLCVYIGPGPKESREKLYRFANSHSEDFNKAKNEFKTKKWFDLHRIHILTKKDYEEKTEKEMIEKLYSEYDRITKSVADLTEVLKKYTQ